MSGRRLKRCKTLTSFSFVEISELEVKGLGASTSSTCIQSWFLLSHSKIDAGGDEPGARIVDLFLILDWTLGKGIQKRNVQSMR